MYPGSYRSSTVGAVGALSLTLAVAGVLGGCASNFDTTGGWFSKPLNPLGNNLGYSYSQLGEPTQKQRPITANDLVEANGACPGRPVPMAPAGVPATAPAEASLLEGGIGIGMSECDVVSRIGAPSAINLSRTPSGDRFAILTYDGGARPGIYRFVGGRLKEMDAVQPPPPPPEVAKKKSTKRSSKKTEKKQRLPKKEDNG